MLLKSNVSSYPQYFYLLLSFYVRAGTRISLRDKRLFEITEVEIARDCTLKRDAVVEWLETLGYGAESRRKVVRSKLGFAIRRLENYIS